MLEAKWSVAPVVWPDGHSQQSALTVMSGTAGRTLGQQIRREDRTQCPALRPSFLSRTGSHYARGLLGCPVWNANVPVLAQKVGDI